MKHHYKCTVCLQLRNGSETASYFLATKCKVENIFGRAVTSNYKVGCAGRVVTDVVDNRPDRSVSTAFQLWLVAHICQTLQDLRGELTCKVKQCDTAVLRFIFSEYYVRRCCSAKTCQQVL